MITDCIDSQELQPSLKPPLAASAMAVNDDASATTIELLSLQVSNYQNTIIDKIALIKSKETDICVKDWTIKELEEVIRSRNDENAILRDNNYEITDELLKLKQLYRQNQLMNAELQDNLLQIELKLSHTNTEKSLIESYVNEIQSQLSEKSRELVIIRLNYTDRVCELESALAAAKADVSKCNDKYKELQDRCHTDQEKIDENLQQICQLETTLITNLSTYTSEIDEVTKVKDMHKKYAEEYVDVINSLKMKAVHDSERNSIHVQTLTDFIDTQRQQMQQIYEEQEAKMAALSDQLEKQSLLHSATNIIGITSDSDDDIHNKLFAAEKRCFDVHQQNIDLDRCVQQLTNELNNNVSMNAHMEEYERLTEAYRDIKDKLDFFVGENLQLKSQYQMCKSKADTYDLLNKDLSKQIQCLLKSRCNDGSYISSSSSGSINEITSTTQVISDHLTTFNDVTELQTRNMQLLETVRLLSSRLGLASVSAIDTTDLYSLGNTINSSLQSAEENGKLKASLAEVALELQNTRESRLKAEGLVEDLLNKIELYKSIIIGKGITNNGIASQISNEQIQSLKARVASLDQENTTLKESCAKCKNTEMSSLDTISNLKASNTAMQIQTTKLNADGRVYVEKIDRLNAAINQMKLDLAHRSQHEGTLEQDKRSIQNQHNILEEKHYECTKELKLLQLTLTQSRMEYDRLKESNVLLGEKLLLSGKKCTQSEHLLHETIDRFQTDMQRKESNAVMELKTENATLRKLEEGTRADLNAKVFSLEQRCYALEEDLSLTRDRLNVSSSEAASLRECILHEQSHSKSANEKSVILEKQNALLSAQLTSLHGGGAFTLTDEVRDKEAQLEQAQLTISTLNEQIALACSHVAMNKDIALGAEEALKHYKDNSVASVNSIELKCNALSDDLAVVTDKLRESEAAASVTKGTYEALLTKYTDAVNAHAVHANDCSNEILSLKKSLAEANRVMELFKAESVRFQQTAKVAYQNYEHENALRVSAEGKVLESERLAAISSANGSKSHDYDALQEQVLCLRRTNEILHGQVQSLGVQLDRLKSTSTSSNDLSSLLPDSRSDASYSNGNGEDKESDLREVIRYMKRERDVLEAKNLDLEIQGTHSKGMLKALQHQLDEARTDLKKMSELKSTGTGNSGSTGGGGGKSSDEFERTISSVMQLNIIRESNAKLAASNEELKERNHRLHNDLLSAKQSIAPLELLNKKLLTDGEMIASELKSKESELDMLQGRLVSLTSMYQAVDPVQHVHMKAEHEEYRERMERERQSLKSLNDNFEKNEEKLRNKMRTYVTRIAELEEVRKERDALAQKCAESATLIDTMKGEIEATAHAIEALKQENVSVRKEIDSIRRDKEKAVAVASATAAATAASVTATSVSSMKAVAATEAAKVIEAVAVAPPAATASRKRKDFVAIDASSAVPIPSDAGLDSDALKSMKSKLVENMRTRKPSVAKEAEVDAADGRTHVAKKTKITEVVPTVGVSVTDAVKKTKTSASPFVVATSAGTAIPPAVAITTVSKALPLAATGTFSTPSGTPFAPATSTPLAATTGKTNLFTSASSAAAKPYINLFTSPASSLSAAASPFVPSTKSIFAAATSTVTPAVPTNSTAPKVTAASNVDYLKAMKSAKNAARFGISVSSQGAAVTSSTGFTDTSKTISSARNRGDENIEDGEEEEDEIPYEGDDNDTFYDDADGDDGDDDDDDDDDDGDGDDDDGDADEGSYHDRDDDNFDDNDDNDDFTNN